jgi:hypothetical protein
MEIDPDKIFLDAIRDGVREGIKQKFNSSYNNPLDSIVTAALGRHKDDIVSLISESIGSLLGNTEFRDSIKAQVASQMSKQLVQKFGGELEKQVNALKSDPATRARITLAIDSIVTSKT